MITDRAVRRGSRSCGFAASGVIPAHVCSDCGDRLLSAWVREERRLLEQCPDYRDAAAVVITGATAVQERALVSKSVDEPVVLAQLARDNAAENLGGIRKAHAGHVLIGALMHGDALARAAQHDPRLAKAKSVRRYADIGLGAAQLTRLAWLAPVRIGRGKRNA